MILFTLVFARPPTSAQSEPLDSLIIEELAKTHANLDFRDQERKYLFRGICAGAIGSLTFYISLMGLGEHGNLVTAGGLMGLALVGTELATKSLLARKYAVEVPQQRIQQLEKESKSHRLISYYQKVYEQHSRQVFERSLKLGVRFGYFYCPMSILFWSVILSMILFY